MCSHTDCGVKLIRSLFRHHRRRAGLSHPQVLQPGHRVSRHRERVVVRPAQLPAGADGPTGRVQLDRSLPRVARPGVPVPELVLEWHSAEANGAGVHAGERSVRIEMYLFCRVAKI